MASEELKPCPFCGSYELNRSTNGVNNHFVCCDQCGAEGPAEVRVHLARCSWNRRAQDFDAMRQRVELLEGLLQRIVGHHIDGNIRPTVRDIINGMPDANDIYEYCEEIIAEIDAALAKQP